MAAGGEALQKALQSVAQSTGWTYSLLWRHCPRQGALVWAEGHYNGAIRTRKTTVHQPGGEGDEEEEETASAAAGAGRAALRRSRQLKELYDSLAAYGGGGADDDGAQAQQLHHQLVAPPPRRPAAALAPEDLTETEWFYLMCASYCFPPAVRLPGEAFVRRVHVWLCGANKVDSKVFSRAILARSAGIQTVACIPVDDHGVLEIGTTEKVEEDICLIHYARSIFMDQHGAPILPTLSGHSITSTPTTRINHQPFQTKMAYCIGDINVQKNSLNAGEERNDEMEADDDDRIDLETNNTENDSRPSPRDNNVANEKEMLIAGSSELMLIGTSARVKYGCSKQEDEEIPVPMVCQNNGNLVAQHEFGPWQHFLDEDLSNKYLQSSAAEDQAVLAENAHYVETVLAILRFNACQQKQAASKTKTYLALSKNSSFSRWTSWNHKASNDLQSKLIPGDAPQRMLKSILLGAPSSIHRSYRGDAVQASPERSPRDDGEGTSRSRRVQVPVQAELSASHVLKERRRREKLNERFVMLRSLVPFVTKMDRASILGDTIEYVKQLRRRIQELESRARLVDSNPKMAMAQTPPAASTETKRGRHHTHSHTSGGYLACADTGTGTTAEASGSCCNSSFREPPAPAGDTEVQVSIIESDALLELRCPHRDGLLLRVMQVLHRDLWLEITSVQASSAGDMLLAELRAKVKEVQGRRSSITEVKRAIHRLIVSSY